MRKLTTEEFVVRARQLLGDSYDYSLVNYAGGTKPVTLVCALHGQFNKLSGDVLRGAGCPTCGVIEGLEKRNSTAREKFFRLAAEVHAGKGYDYSDTLYIDGRTKVQIHCPAHGSFWQLPHPHLRGQNCPSCATLAMSLTLSDFLVKAKLVHGVKYDYSKSTYLGANKKIEVVCPLHGSFYQIATDHMRGHGCPTCSNEARAAEQKARNFRAATDFAIKAEKVHNGLYDYSYSTYCNALAPVTISCRLHGDFEMPPSRHLAGQGCPKCGNARKGEEKKHHAEQNFEAAARKVHGSQYSYANAEYVGSKTNLTITCPEHGDFYQFPNNHLNGAGCPRCAAKESQGEAEVRELLVATGAQVLREDRKVIAPLELDMVLPSRKLAVEYCGLYWHRSSNYVGENTGSLKSVTYHLDKLNRCEQAGYRLLTIFEDEWLTGKDKVASMLSRIATPGNLQAVGGRECSIVAPSSAEAAKFYRINHLSGPVSSGVPIGLSYRGDLICVATFSKPRAIFGGDKPLGEYELVRFAQKSGALVHGALDKLVAEFSNRCPEAEALISFVDRRWFTGKTYLSAKFTLVGTTAPNYWYVKGQTRYHRYTFAKHKLLSSLKIFDPGKTEKENMALNGYYTIHDCGSLKFRREL